MATIIDSLIVELGLDPSQMNAKSKGAVKSLQDLEKQSEGTEKSVKKIGESSKRTAGGIDTLTKAAAAFLAVLGGTAALKHFVLDSIASGAALDRLSRNLGLNVETISAWGNAVEQIGGSAKGLQGTMEMLSRSQTELRVTGTTALIPYFSALGIALSDVHGKALPVDNILLQLATRFEGMDRTQANNLGRMIGIDQDTLNLLLQGRKELELTLARQKENAVVTKKQAEEDAKLQKTIIGLKQEFAAFGRGLLQQASPALEKLLALLKTFGDWVQSHGEFIKDFLKVLAVGLAAIAALTIPIDLTVISILALAAAIALVWEDYQTWKKGGKSFIDWDKWEPGIQKAIDKITELRDLIKDTFGWLNKIANKDKDAYTKAVNDPTQKRAEIGNPLKWLLGKDYDPNSKGAKFLNSIFGQGGPLAESDPKSVFAQQDNLSDAIAKQEGFYAKGNTPNRPQRNHNPGNIKDGEFARKHGAIGNDGPFAIFPSDQAGMAALRALLASKSYAGLSLEQKLAKYAPASDNNDTGAYLAGVKQSLMNGIPGASNPVASAGSSTGAGNTDKSVSLKVDNLQVVTQATDAKGIAAGVVDALQDYLFTSQANTGLN